MKHINVWLDNDLRNRIPPLPYNVWFAKDFEKMVDYVIENASLIEHISFDNDLGIKLEGHQIAAQICNRIVKDKVLFPRLKSVVAHSGNVVAAERITGWFGQLVRMGHLNCEVIRQEYRPSGLEKFNGIIF